MKKSRKKTQQIKTSFCVLGKCVVSESPNQSWGGRIWVFVSYQNPFQYFLNPQITVRVERAQKQSSPQLCFFFFLLEKWVVSESPNHGWERKSLEIVIPPIGFLVLMTLVWFPEAELFFIDTCVQISCGKRIFFLIWVGGRFKPNRQRTIFSGHYITQTLGVRDKSTNNLNLLEVLRIGQRG